MALVVEAKERIAWREKEIDDSLGDEVLIAPMVVGLCGTDLEIISGLIDPAYVRYPVVLGHEWAGVVKSNGPLLGKLVVVEGIIPCWHCAMCRAGRTNLCDVYQEIGFTRDGAAAQLISVPSQLIHALAPGITPLQGCLVEPLAVAYQAILKSTPAPNLKVLIVGDGTIALLVAHLLGLFSPSAVDMLGQRPTQVDLAATAGVRNFYTSPDQVGAVYDLVFEAAGSPESVETAVQKAKRGATVTLLGLTGNASRVSLVVDDLVNNDLQIVGSFSYTAKSFGEIVRLINSSQIAPEFLITHKFPIKEWAEALATLSQSVGARGKVVLELDQVPKAP